MVGALSWWRWSERSPVGTSRRVELEWTCWNSIFWTDPDREEKWWAGHDPVVVGAIETSIPSAGGPNGIHHARGELRFDGERTATFFSDAGGKIPLTLQTGSRAYFLDCAGQPSR